MSEEAPLVRGFLLMAFEMECAMIRRILKDRNELSVLVLAILSLCVLWTSVYEVPLISFLQGGVLSDLLANQYARSIGGTLAGGIVSAYMIYVLVELLPRHRREKTAVYVLNKLINSIVDALETGKLFQHERSIEFSEPVLDWTRLCDNLTYLRYGQDFLHLKSAGHTAETRYESFKDTLVLAADISPLHAESWLVVTDKVRLLAEVMGERPDGDLEIDVLADYKNIQHEKYRSNPTAMFYRSICFRSIEFIEAAQSWKKLVG